MSFDPEKIGLLKSSSTVNDSTLSAMATLTGPREMTEDEIRKARKKRKNTIERIFQNMPNAEQVDLCFLVDCTGSMVHWIKAVKDMICNLADRLCANYSHLKLRVAFVRYTDFDQPKLTRTTWIDFSTDIGKFKDFVGTAAARATGGGDDAEDVFGGLEAVINLKWNEHGTKVMIHIADSPCHGDEYHHPSVRDDHQSGDPGKRELDNLIQGLVKHNIMYHFGYIKEDKTKKMICTFDKSLQKYHGHSIETFDATEASRIEESIYRSVSSSISSTVTLLTHGIHSRRKVEFVITRKEPDWSMLEPCTVTAFPPPSSRDRHQRSASTGTTPQTVMMTINVAPNPFAEGGNRIAYHALDTKSNTRLILKEFKWNSNRYRSRKRYLEICSILEKASTLAQMFNAEKPSGTPQIMFTPVGRMEFPPDEHGNCRRCTYEAYIRGKYEKFNSNAGYTSETSDATNEACQAFSHYTWVNSEGDNKLVVCDIQGVKTTLGVLLTDPAIHHHDELQYGPTNLGNQGIKKFFEKHKCNNICVKMDIASKRPI